MIWIGFHGFLFLGLFSDFYKTKYTGGKSSAKKMQNGMSGGGACMPVLDENGSAEYNSVSSYAMIYNKEYNSCYSNGTNNGYVANNNITEKKLA